MKELLQIAQVALAVLLVAAILLQNRGAGLSGVFGGAGNIYRTKRGIEKSLFFATIAISVLFFVVALASVVL